MTNTLLLIVTVIANSVGSAFNNLFGKKFVKSNTDITRLMMFSSLFSIVTFVIVALFNGGLHMPSLYTVLMGVLFGMILVGFSLCNYRALAIGSFAYTSLFASCGMVLSVAFSVVWFHESVDVFQIIGVILILIMFYFNANPKKNEQVSVKWLVFALLVFILNGSFGIMQRLFQAYTPDGEPQMAEFLITAFLFTAIASFAVVAKSKKSVAKVFDFDKRIIAVAVVVGICTALTHRINLYLSGAMPSIIFFPIANGASVVLCAVISAIVFKEKYNAKQYVGLGFGIAAILLLSGIMNNFIKI